MRYALISDVHGNLTALRTVLKALETHKVDRYLCLGDIVGYGANPNECVQLVRSVTDKVVAGNHDCAAVGRTDFSNFNSYAREAVLWTANHLSQESKEYLTTLPIQLTVSGFTCVHATPRNPELWEYLLSPYQALAAFNHFEGNICFIAHSHRPMAFIQGQGKFQWDFSERLQTEITSRYIISIGSVGQPRDRDPRACFVLFDTDTLEVKTFRVEYDISEPQAAIRAAGLPEFLAERLQFGE